MFRNPIFDKKLTMSDFIIALINGIGNIVCGLSHYLQEPLDPAAVIFGSGEFSAAETTDEDALCTAVAKNNSTNNESQCESLEQGLISGILLFIIGQLLRGVGSASLPLLFSYLDDSVAKKKLTTYTCKY